MGGGGEFLTYVDSDDYLALDIYEKCINKFKDISNTDMIIYSICTIYDKHNQVTNNLDLDNLSSDFILKEYESGNTYDGINALTCGKIHRTCNVINIKFNEGRVYEDASYNYEIFALTKNTSLLSSIGYYYRRTNAASTSYNTNDNIMDLFFNLEALRSKYLIENNQDLVAGVNTLLITHLRKFIYKLKNRPIYEDYIDVIKRTRKYPIRVSSKSNYYIRYRLFSYIPKYSFIIERFIDKMYNLVVPKLKQIYKK